ncbi:MAG: hypothetical protein ACRDJ9_13200 [Dehalococcoidia bacterium]
MGRAQSIASSFEIGIHNSATMALPAATYGVLMFLPAALFGYAISRRPAAEPAPEPASPAGSV